MNDVVGTINNGNTLQGTVNYQGGGSGATEIPNYNDLPNKPSINGVELVDNKTLKELGIDLEGVLQEAKDYTDNEIATFDFIKIVEALPETGLPNRFYFVPKSDTQTQDLFDEYVWVNKGTEEEPNWDWEWITTKQVEIDLSGFVKFTDYASATKTGVIKTYNNYGTTIWGGYLVPLVKTYAEYIKGVPQLFIGKGTLDNVLRNYDGYFADDVNADEPDITIEITEDCSLIYVTTDNNGNAFDFDEIMGVFDLTGVTSTAEARMTFAPKEINASYNGIIIANTNGSTTADQVGEFVVKKNNILGWYSEYMSTTQNSWLAGNSNVGRHVRSLYDVTDDTKLWKDITSIKEFTIMPYSGSFHAGSVIKIWGRRAE